MLSRSVVAVLGKRGKGKRHISSLVFDLTELLAYQIVELFIVYEQFSLHQIILQMGPDAHENRVPLEGLGDVIHRTAFDSPFDALRRVQTGYEYNGDIPGLDILFQEPAVFETRHLRHRDIRKYQLRKFGLNGFHRKLDRRDRTGYQPRVPDYVSQHYQIGRDIIQDQNVLSFNSFKIHMPPKAPLYSSWLHRIFPCGQKEAAKKLFS